MDTCIFCEIISRRRPAEFLYENDDAIAILDIRPIHYGHTLVIPKLHCTTFLEVPPERLAGLMKATQIISRALVESLELKGFNIFSNNGAVAGQSVFHCHFHVTPRYREDNISFILELKRYSDGEMQHFADRIRKHIGA